MQAGLAVPVAASLLLGAAAAAVLLAPAPSPRPLAPLRLPHLGGNAVAAGPAGRPDADVAAILARPLFNMTRRPPADAPPGAVSAAVPRLSGILVIGPFRRAVFETPSTDGSGKPLAVGIGGHAGPYTVRAISTHAVTVLASDGERTLKPVPLPNDQQSAANAPSAPTVPISPPLLPTAFGNVAPSRAVPGQHVPSPLENLLARLRSRH